MSRSWKHYFNPAWKLPHVEPFPSMDRSSHNLANKKPTLSPNFTVGLLRTPHLSPHWAQFRVPLWFSKLDMRDYLFHAYNVRTYRIRSFVQGWGIKKRLGYPKNPNKRLFFRPKSRKRMTVELEKPFVWPDPPKDLEAWDNKQYKETNHGSHVYKKEIEEARRARLRESAQYFLKGQTRWDSSR
ncbi:MAG: hypothetical protein M1831_006586 [Alyxoria varia]|nr:MAG: hypothetical protein M1831_006586 [Alyxoria varia]